MLPPLDALQVHKECLGELLRFDGFHVALGGGRDLARGFKGERIFLPSRVIMVVGQ